MGSDTIVATKRSEPVKKEISPALQKLEEDFIKAGGKWKDYSVNQLFSIQNTLSFNKDVLTEGDGYDYVTRTSQNQGILCTTGFVNQENINEAGTWSLGLLQMDFFYRKKTWYAGQFVRKIVPLIPLSRYGVLYFTVLLNGLSQYLLSGLVRDVDDKFLSSTFELPMKNNEIDFQYIENYIKTLEAERIETLEAERIETLEAYLTVTGLKDYKLTEKEEQLLDSINSNTQTESRVEEWGYCKLSSIFNIFTGRDVIIGKTESGNIPLVSHQHQNNGIVSYISKLANRRLFLHEETLALADRGVFLATTQGNNFHIGTRVKALQFKMGRRSREERLFITATINKLQILFTEYSSNATDKLPDLKILLPLKNKKIDYSIMNDLIKSVEKLIIKDLAEWTDKKIQATKEVVFKS